MAGESEVVEGEGGKGGYEVGFEDYHFEGGTDESGYVRELVVVQVYCDQVGERGLIVIVMEALRDVLNEVILKVHPSNIRHAH